ncbi:hypothetical protein HK096_001769, partial [Nowakowskiella sp. JEL0078]
MDWIKEDVSIASELNEIALKNYLLSFLKTSLVSKESFPKLLEMIDDAPFNRVANDIDFLTLLVVRMLGKQLNYAKTNISEIFETLEIARSRYSNNELATAILDMSHILTLGKLQKVDPQSKIDSTIDLYYEVKRRTHNVSGVKPEILCEISDAFFSVKQDKIAIDSLIWCMKQLESIDKANIDPILIRKIIRLRGHFLIKLLNQNEPPESIEVHGMRSDDNTAAELRNKFQKFGNIISLTLTRDKKTKIYDGSAIIKYKHPSSIFQVLEQENLVIQEQPVSISPRYDQDKLKIKAEEAFRIFSQLRIPTEIQSFIVEHKIITKIDHTMHLRLLDFQIKANIMPNIISVLDQMTKRNLPITPIPLSWAVTALAKGNEAIAALPYYSLLLRTLCNVESDQTTLIITPTVHLLTCLLKTSNIKAANYLITELLNSPLTDTSVHAINALIKGTLINTSNFLSALGIFRRFLTKNIRPNNETFEILLTGIFHSFPRIQGPSIPIQNTVLEQVDEILDIMKRSEVTPTVPMLEPLVKIYIKLRRNDLAEKILQNETNREASHKDTLTYHKLQRMLISNVLAVSGPTKAATMVKGSLQRDWICIKEIVLAFCHDVGHTVNFGEKGPEIVYVNSKKCFKAEELIEPFIALKDRRSVELAGIVAVGFAKARDMEQCWRVLKRPGVVDVGFVGNILTFIESEKYFSEGTMTSTSVQWFEFLLGIGKIPDIAAEHLAGVEIACAMSEESWIWGL